MVGKSAAHITLIQRMRQLAARYKVQRDTPGRWTSYSMTQSCQVHVYVRPYVFKHNVNTLAYVCYCHCYCHYSNSTTVQVLLLLLLLLPFLSSGA